MLEFASNISESKHSNNPNRSICETNNPYSSTPPPLAKIDRCQGCKPPHLSAPNPANPDDCGS